MTDHNQDPADTENIPSIDEQRLIAQAGKLGAAHQPERDLWPAIAQQITSHTTVQPAKSWMPLALAASVMLTAISLAFSSYVYFNQPEAKLVVVNDPVDSIEQPYILARAAYLEELLVQDEQLSPEVIAVLNDNLDVIDNAITEIRKALKDNPEDAMLLDTLIQTREKEMALFRQLTTQRITSI